MHSTIIEYDRRNILPVSLAALMANANFGLHRECMWQALPLPSCMANIKFCEMFMQAKDNFLYANNFPFLDPV